MAGSSIHCALLTHRNTYKSATLVAIRPGACINQH